MKLLFLLIVLAPLAGAIAVGLYGQTLGRERSHQICIGGVAISCLLSLIVFLVYAVGGREPVDTTVYTWLFSDGMLFQVGFLVDALTATMMLVVTFVSLMVHVYTIGYMHDDPGYQRFFAYISLFTFSMLMLVMANNFLQLFFGWEAVGLVSYLLIGFWYKKPTAIAANMKAFLVNRVGDFGFLLGIAAVATYTGSLTYADTFAQVESLRQLTLPLLGAEPPLLDVACILLFVGAMGKSAQMPLHVWLPDSMEGPTPISALIHAATMVTAGIFMVARMSPLFEYAPAALTVVLVLGAATALLMGLVGVVQHDIKRVVAYSTLSQLGYMTAALGASAYGAAIFHLVTHAFFKALLFLAAGSVIIALHHEQDMRRMGGLRRQLPITCATAWIGSLALIGFPGFAGFFSKDGIIEAVHASQTTGSGLAYTALLVGVFFTALYTFRMIFLVFHGESRLDAETASHVHEPPRVVTWPLIALAVPSVLAGAVLAGPMLFGEYFGDAIYTKGEAQQVMAMAAEHGEPAGTHAEAHSKGAGHAEEKAGGHAAGDGHGGDHHEAHGAWDMFTHGLTALPTFFAAAGFLAAVLLYLVMPGTGARVAKVLRPATLILEARYGFDAFNEKVIAAGTRAGAGLLSGVGDRRIIDGMIVNGTASAIGRLAGLVRHLQSGFLYHYAFAMIIGLLALLWFFGIAQ